MRIAWITYDWSTDTGGKGVATNAFIRHLVSRGHQVTLVDLEMGPVRELRRNRLPETVSVRPLWVGGMAGAVRKLWRIAQLLRGHHLAIVGAAPNIDIVLLLALVPLRVVHRAKLVRLEFTNPHTYLRHSRLAPLYNALGRVLFPHLAHSIAPSRGAADQLVTRYGVPRERASVIPWPCVPENMPDLCAESVPESLFGDGRPRHLLVSVMRLSMQDKDFRTLLDAFKLIRQEEPEAELAVLGAGDPAPVEAMVRERGLAGAVHLMGERKYPYPYVARADLFLFASKYEGSPLVIAEALACGCPVVATDCDFGPRELIENGSTGYLVPVGGSAELAARAVELLRNPALRGEMAERGRSSSAPYGVAASAGAIEALLAEVAGR